MRIVFMKYAPNLVLLLLMVSASANAGLITQVFSGELLDVEFFGDDPFSGQIGVGDSFFGGYFFDSDAQPKEGDACAIGSQCRWEFPVPPYLYAFGIDGVFGSFTGPELEVVVTNNSVAIGGFTGGDAVSVSSNDSDAIFGGLISTVEITFVDLTGTAIDDPSILPLVDLSLADYTFDPFPEFIPRSFSVSGDWGVLRGSVNSIRTIPEPGTLALFAIGLAGMGLVRRRKRTV